MKRVGVLTFHRAINYGAVLQTYALCKTIEKMGAKAEVIDYRCNVIEDFYYKIFSEQNTMKQNIKNLLFCRKQKKRNMAFASFRDTYLPLSEKSYFPQNDKRNLERQYDTFFVGSDQVWNYSCIGGDKTFLLDFVSDAGKKNSYAASFGKMTAEQIEQMNFKEALSTFSMISVRENEGKELVKKELGIEAHIDLDPTLLLDEKEWEKVAAPVEETNYLLVYSVNLPEKVIEEARRVAKEKNLKLVVITLENKYKPKEGEIDKSECSPGEFLGYFFNADYVITNSFHGTVFSIIAQKQFYTIKNAKTGLDNSRLETLLCNLQLEDRLAEKVDEMETGIDYHKVFLNKTKLKNESLKYLQQIVSE